MAYKALYVDDETHNAEPNDVVDVIENDGVFSCDLIFPPQQLSAISTNYDVYLLDLDLTSASEDQQKVSYRGSTLAAELRLRTQSKPIILLTRETVIDSSSWWKQILENNLDVDEVMYKGELIKAPESHRKQIIILIEGYSDLANITGSNWRDVLGLLKADQNSQNKIKEANPPVNGNNWNIPHTSRWIRNVLMEFPGIMYDALHASAKLGISVDTFTVDQVINQFSDALYVGPFADQSNPRWWSHLLLQYATKLIMEQETHGPTHKAFGEAFYKAFKIQLTPSKCVYDDSPNANYICHIYQEPVQPGNSIPYYPDNRPSSMETARVSFKAIKESNVFDELLVADSDLPLVNKLWDES